MDKESIIYDTATISDIPELVRLRILYMTDDFGSLTNEEREGMEKQLPGYFERELGKKLIAFVTRAEGRLVAAAYLLIIEKPANPFIERPVRDLHSEKRVPPLFCKVIVDGDKVTLESKGKDNKKQTISWRDMVYQVETAIEDASMKPSK